MEEEDISDIIEFAKSYAQIEAVYLGRTPSGESTVYFYVPNYHWDRELQTKIDKLDRELGLEMGMLAFRRSPKEAEKQKKLEKIIWEKN